MTCPTSVPTFLIKGCNQELGYSIQDGFTTQTAEHQFAFAGRGFKKENEKITFKIIITRDIMINEIMKWYYNTIANGTAPFAVYTMHRGVLRWWVVKLVTTPMKFGKISGGWEAILEADVIGYALDATDPVPPKRVVTDSGDYIVTDSGKYVTTDAVPGTATNIICGG